MSKKLNRVKCKNCGDVIVSRHRHDFVTCSCFRPDNNMGVFCDGGNDYQRIGGIENALIFKDRKWIPLNLK